MTGLALIGAAKHMALIKLRGIIGGVVHGATIL
jgi:hypothetical protein